MRHDLTMLPGADPTEAARALVAVREDAVVRAVMNRLSPAEAALVVTSAPGVEAQTRLIWALAKPRRAAVVDHMAPVAMAAMIQNRERRNRRLLGDVSLEGFERILAFCSPAQRYYWLSLANSFADAGANLLVLLLPPEQVAEALLTVPEFRSRLHRLRAFSPGGFDETPPVADERLKAVLLRLIEYDADCYRDVIEAAFRLLDRGVAPPVSARQPAGHESIELPGIPEVPPLLPAAPDAEAPDAAPAFKLPPYLPMPVHTGDGLVRAATRMLSPARRQALQRETERAFSDEVRADGGSLAMADLERAAARVQAYIRLGLQGMPDQPEQVAAALEKVPLRDIVRRGSLILEQLRQVAVRLSHFTPAMDARQRDLLNAVLRPRVTFDGESASAALWMAAPDRRRRPEAVPVAEIQERLADLSVWVATARALGLRALTERLAAAMNGSLAVSAALGVALLTYGHWDPRALESDALRRFRDSHFDRERGAWRAGTEEAVRGAADTWAQRARIEAAMRPRVVSRVLEAMRQLEGFLRVRQSVSWDRFAPGKPTPRRRVARDVEDGEEEETS
ncbi:MAG: hypothetical protein HY321_00500 [Armatimonadetes bacterium]|nr:hypothetical protein [Armatimonadota bacterium]